MSEPMCDGNNECFRLEDQLRQADASLRSLRSAVDQIAEEMRKASELRTRAWDWADAVHVWADRLRSLIQGQG